MLRPKSLAIRVVFLALVIGVGLGALVASLLVPTPEVPPRLRLFAFAGLQTLLLLAAPLALLRLVGGFVPSDFGIVLGQPRRWLREVGLLFLVALPLLVCLSRDPSIRAVYPTYSFARETPWLLVPAAAAFGVYGFAWEFLFRGLLQLGTRPVLGWGSVLLPLAPFVAVHHGKPPIELALSAVSGLVLGVLVHRHSTILPAWLLHWGSATVLNGLCLL